MEVKKVKAVDREDDTPAPAENAKAKPAATPEQAKEAQLHTEKPPPPAKPKGKSKTLPTPAKQKGNAKAQPAPAKQKGTAKAQPTQPNKAKPKAKTKRPRVPDSSDDDDHVTPSQLKAAREDAVKWTSRKKPQFSAQRVFDAVLGKDGARPSSKEAGVAAKMPAFFGPQEKREWKEWLATTADHIDQVPKAERKTTCPMPMKCLPADAPIQDAPPRMQLQMLTYQNQDAGDYASKEELQRDLDAKSALSSDDVPIGSVVALWRGYDWEAAHIPGWDTPFFVADVIKVNPNTYPSPNPTLTLFLTLTLTDLALTLTLAITQTLQLTVGGDGGRPRGEQQRFSSSC
jgi:hypothetical protein